LSSSLKISELLIPLISMEAEIRHGPSITVGERLWTLGRCSFPRHQYNTFALEEKMAQEFKSEM